MPSILLVDDDPAWRALYRMGFESHFDLFEAVDGFEALAVLERGRGPTSSCSTSGCLG